jgi:hypothetical protein
MAVAAKIHLPFFATAIAILTSILMQTVHADAEALCGGSRYEVSVLPRGVSPYIQLSAEGVSGPFLIDYGSTRSSLSASVFGGVVGTVR